MASALIYLFVALVVGAVIFLLASVVFGRGEQLESLPPGATPTRLPAADVEGSDLRKLRFQQVVRGYKAAEVDWALERVAGELDTLRGRVALLERQLQAADEQLHGGPPTGAVSVAESASDTGTGTVSAGTAGAVDVDTQHLASDAGETDAGGTDAGETDRHDDPAEWS